VLTGGLVDPPVRRKTMKQINPELESVASLLTRSYDGIKENREPSRRRSMSKSNLCSDLIPKDSVKALIGSATSPIVLKDYQTCPSRMPTEASKTKHLRDYLSNIPLVRLESSERQPAHKERVMPLGVRDQFARTFNIFN